MKSIRALRQRWRDRGPPDKRCSRCREYYNILELRYFFGSLEPYGKLKSVSESEKCPMCKAVLRRLSHDLHLLSAHKDAPSWDDEILWDCTGFDGGLERAGVALFLNDVIRGTVRRWTGDEPLEQRFLEDGSVDVSQISKWLVRCQEEHGPACPTNSLEDRTEIRLIDVVDGRLIETNQPLHYFALSYVWGRAESLQTTLANVDELSQHGALENHPEVCKVIVDAMNLVRRLDYRYLWVDALCIVQDDYERKPALLAQMGEIYRRALLTIIAMSGSDATTGLAGISPDSRSPIWTLTTPYQDYNVLCTPPPLLDLINSSWYDTRAWTFQERLLSTRCLYVSDQQMYFQCQNSVWQEDALDLCTPDKVNPLLGGPITATSSTWADFFQAYMLLVKLYTKKNLTYSSDILDAFQGIATSLTKRLGSGFINGLPEAVFDIALLWRPVRKPRPTRRKAFASRTSSILQHHPSWCWSGWVGQATFLMDHEFRNTAVAPFNQRVSFVLGLSPHDGKLPLKPMVSTFTLCSDGETRTIRRDPALCEEAGDLAETNLQSTEQEAKAIPPGLQVLLFKTTSVTIGSFEIATEGIDESYHLHDKDDGELCGKFYPSLDSFRVEEGVASRREYILLSLLEWPKTDDHFWLFLGSDSDVARQRIAAHWAQPLPRRWSIAVIMMIEWKEMGAYAERMGIGVVTLDAWEARQPVEKWIKLA